MTRRRAYRIEYDVDGDAVGDAVNEDQLPRGPLPADAPGGGDDVAAFRRGLFARTPRVWVTPSLVAINVAVFVAMVASGVHPMSPTIDSLLKWGADYAPRTTAGQWWRLLTNTFVHVGALHIGMNMIGLWQIGFLVERLLGNRGFLVAYLVSGLCGSVASLAWHPFVVSAGASGAVFGVYGVLIAYLIRSHRAIPSQVLQPLRKSAVFFVGLNLVFGMQNKSIDMAAHVGGLLAGIASGLVLIGSSGVRDRAAASGGPSRRAGLLAIVGLAAVTGGAALLPRAVDFQAEMVAFETMERETIDAYNGAVERRHNQAISDDQLARVIDEQVLPAWKQSARRLRALGRLPAPQQRRVDALVRYLDLRGRAWSTLAGAIRTDDGARAAEAKALDAEAAAQVKAALDATD